MTDVPPETGTIIPDDDHVLRYVAPRHVENGVVNGEGFLRRPAEDASSVNWLECFDPPVEQQVDQVRGLARIRYAKTGQLAKLNVGYTRNYVKDNAPDSAALVFVHDPLAAEGEHSADPSHALIQGMPTAETVEAALVKDLIADCIILPLFAAVPKKEEA